VPVSNFEYVELIILWAWDAFAPFLGVLQPIGTVLFYTWLAAYNAAIPRKLIWIESQKSQGLGCSECNWVFKPSGTPIHESLDEMKQKYEDQRDKEFAAHVCVKHARAKRPKTE